LYEITYLATGYRQIIRKVVAKVHGREKPEDGGRAYSSVILVSAYKFRWMDNPGDNNLDNQWHGNLKANIEFTDFRFQT
jgi:hypothetical protein